MDEESESLSPKQPQSWSLRWRPLRKLLGLLAPIREFTGWVADFVRYHRAPHQARLLMRAAEKIKDCGLPALAVEDKLLQKILTEGPMEDDPSMQERWVNLLANAGIVGDATVRAAFPGVLSELEPNEAALLDEFASRASEKSFRDKKFSPEKPGEGGPMPELDISPPAGTHCLWPEYPDHLRLDIR